MSYEGYEVWRCKNGHEKSFSCYDTPEPRRWRCPECSARVKWINAVDQTNPKDVAYGFREVDKNGFYMEPGGISECEECKKYIDALVEIACVLGMPYEGKAAMAREALPEEIRNGIKFVKRWRSIGEGLGHRVVVLETELKRLRACLDLMQEQHDEWARMDGEHRRCSAGVQGRTGGDRKRGEKPIPWSKVKKELEENHEDPQDAKIVSEAFALLPKDFSAIGHNWLERFLSACVDSSKKIPRELFRGKLREQKIAAAIGEWAKWRMSRFSPEERRWIVNGGHVPCPLCRVSQYHPYIPCYGCPLDAIGQNCLEDGSAYRKVVATHHCSSSTRSARKAKMVRVLREAIDYVLR